VPSGNFGNALGGYYAMKMGLPVEKILIASNRNNMRDTRLVATTSPAMDILKSSNVERILFDFYGAERTRDLMRQLDEERYYELTPEELAKLQTVFSADYCTDEEGLAYIRSTFEDNGYLMDPHTATCFKAWETQADQTIPTIAYSTAEWTKFSPTIATALTGQQGESDLDALKAIAEKADIDIPTQIAALFDRDIAQRTVIDKDDIEKEILGFLEASNG